MSNPIARTLLRVPGAKSLINKLAEPYRNLAGYRQVGLRHDDLIDTLNPVVTKAVSRLPMREKHDRVYRHRRAMQCSLAQTILPKEEWTKPEEDVPYLQPYIDEIIRENAERAELDSLVRAK
ncbi:14 kDa subunit of cytochrome bd ubiquinol oxidase [Ascodesmis nigricans]|uniref:Complex III subunit 7 n=1 Tax=Ascodesmis nigricans TaxID=341454 RepID=A0A4S2N4H4_9PEZI|nr:14 kDa subunit of cytochrome bd ubiquinol oxidase [Ascodesmis nigricans]